MLHSYITFSYIKSTKFHLVIEMKYFSNHNLAYNQNASNYQKFNQYSYLQLTYLIKINIKDIKYFAGSETGQVKTPCFSLALSSAALLS